MSIIRSRFDRPQIRVSNVSAENYPVYRNLEREKWIIINGITRIKDRIGGNNTALHPIRLECQLDMINSYSEQLLRCQSKIEELDIGDNCRAELEDLIVETKTAIKTILAKNKTKLAEDTLIASHNPELPKVNLPIFDGKYAEYKNFISRLESLVHNDSTKSNIAKFNCLVSSLSGEPLDMLFKRAAENYAKALAKLKEKYDNKYLKFFDAIAELFELTNITNLPELRNMLDSASAIYDSLISLGNEENITNAIVIQLVLHKVDLDTRSRFKEQLDPGKIPTWHDLKIVLNKCYQQLSADEASTSSAGPPIRGYFLGPNILNYEEYLEWQGSQNH